MNAKELEVFKELVKLVEKCTNFGNECDCYYRPSNYCSVCRQVTQILQKHKSRK